MQMCIIFVAYGLKSTSMSNVALPFMHGRNDVNSATDKILRVIFFITGNGTQKWDHVIQMGSYG